MAPIRLTAGWRGVACASARATHTGSPLHQPKKNPPVIKIVHANKESVNGTGETKKRDVRMAWCNELEPRIHSGVASDPADRRLCKPGPTVLRPEFEQVVGNGKRWRYVE